MKLTQADVGKKFKLSHWDHPVKILCVGKTHIFAEEKSGYDCFYFNDDFWIPYEEPKKKIRMAPALCHDTDVYYLSCNLFTTEIDAIKEIGKERFICWPANDNMWVEVEE